MHPEQLVRLSTRIPVDLFFRLEEERHRLSVVNRRRVSAQALVQKALEDFLKDSREEVQP